MKTYNEETLLQDVYNLILDVRVTEEERKILLDVKKQLEEKVYILKIKRDLRVALGNLAREHKLSEPIDEFFINLYSDLGEGLKIGHRQF